jgi:outer membrane receptor for ferrienterochelin and colicins
MMRKIQYVFLVAAIAGGIQAGENVETNQAVRANEIVVTASRIETLLETTPEVIHVINRQDVEEIQPYKTGELLDYVAGVGTATGTGSGQPKRTVISLNGLPPKYTLVLVDGVPLLSEHIHTGQNIELVPPSSIERIEVMRGAASAQYGSDAIGGVVNIITRKAKQEPEISIGASVGSYDTYGSYLNLLLPLSKGVGLSSTVDWEESDGQPLLEPKHRIGNTGYKSVKYFNRLDADLSDKTHAFVAFNGAENEMEWFGDWAESRLLAPSIGLDQQLSSDVLLSTQLSYSDWEAEVSSERNRLAIPEAYLRWTAGKNHVLMTGADYRYNTFERTAVVAPAQQAYGLFAQDEWSALQDLEVTMALRYDKTEGIEGAVSPKIAALWYLADGRVGLRTSAACGYHAPTLQELYEEGYGHGGADLRYGNPDLQPEYSTTYMAGVELQPIDELQLMLNGFYTDFNDMIVPVFTGTTGGTNVWQRTNIQEAEVYGVDLGIGYQFTSRFRLEGGCTYSDNRDKETGRQLPYSPGTSVFGKLVYADQIRSHNVSAFLGLRSAFGREAWNWKPETGAPVGDPDGMTTELEDYVTLDIGMTVDVTKRLQCFAKVENLLGENIENLDDSYTIIDGEPFVRIGVKYNIMAAKK